MTGEIILKKILDILKRLERWVVEKGVKQVIVASLTS